MSCETPIGLAVQKYRNECAGDAKGQVDGIPPGLKRVTQDNSDYQRDSNRDGKRDGESGHVNRSHQQKIGEVEERPSEERVHNV